MAVHPTVAAEHARLLATLPFDDTRDLEDADRGFLGTLDPPQVRDAAGRVVWDASAYDVVAGDEGVVVIDTLLSVETGRAALGLYRAHRGDRHDDEPRGGVIP